MSRLVQLWEQSYTFTEDELSFFAESQKALAQAFQVPRDAGGEQHVEAAELEQGVQADIDRRLGADKEIDIEAR